MIDVSRRQDGLTNSDLGWIRHRSRSYLTNMIADLRMAMERRMPALRHAEPSLRSAIIVGAGPSLEKNRHLLAKAQSQGWTIICVNASLPAILEHVEPDYCVARELFAVHLGMPEMPPRTKLLVSLGANTSVFERAYAWWVAAEARSYDICSQLGVRPVNAGSAALTAAAWIALQAGAKRIAVVGTDLAFARGGRGYASSSQWEGVDLDGDGESATLRDEGLSVHRGVAFASGHQPSLSVSTRTEEAPALDGGPPLRTLQCWTNQATWLEDLAAHWPGVYWINATEGGRALKGWRPTTMEDLLKLEPSSVGYRLRMFPAAQEDYERWRTSVLRSCDRLERIANEVLAPTEDGFACIDGFHIGAQMVEVWAQRDYIDAEGLPVAEQLECYERARINAARAVRGMLEG